MLLADGMPMNVLSDILGHSLTSTTVGIYAHVAPTARREAAAAMDRLLGQISGGRGTEAKRGREQTPGLVDSRVFTTFFWGA